jgi:hypothetical protein
MGVRRFSVGRKLNRHLRNMRWLFFSFLLFSSVGRSKRGDMSVAVDLLIELNLRILEPVKRRGYEQDKASTCNQLQTTHESSHHQYKAPARIQTQRNITISIHLTPFPYTIRYAHDTASNHSLAGNPKIQPHAPQHKSEKRPLHDIRLSP